jgi:geranylgeranyl pyrophosphate synthase
MGAIIANASENDTRHLYEFGQNIGIAFQIQDDILDLYADPEKFGKQVGGDVISNKKTLLNLKALELATTKQQDYLRELAVEKDPSKKIIETTQIYNEIGAKEACEVVMQAYYEKAVTALNAIEINHIQKGMDQFEQRLYEEHNTDLSNAGQRNSIAMGEKSAIVLDSTRVSNKKIIESGFTFKYELLEQALKNFYGN